MEGRRPYSPKTPMGGIGRQPQSPSNLPFNNGETTVVKNSRKQKNLVGLIGQLETDLTIAQTELKMHYASGVAATLWQDIENLKECLNYYIDMHQALTSDAIPLSEEDFPF